MPFTWLVTRSLIVAAATGALAVACSRGDSAAQDSNQSQLTRELAQALLQDSLSEHIRSIGRSETEATFEIERPVLGSAPGEPEPWSVTRCGKEVQWAVAKNLIKLTGEESCDDFSIAPKVPAPSASTLQRDPNGRPQAYRVGEQLFLRLGDVQARVTGIVQRDSVEALAEYVVLLKLNDAGRAILEPSETQAESLATVGEEKRIGIFQKYDDGWRLIRTFRQQSGTDGMQFRF